MKNCSQKVVINHFFRMRGYLNGVTAFAPHLINVCIREQDEIQTTKTQNLWTLLKINTDELTADLTKVKLNINSTHTPKKEQSRRNVWLQSTTENVMEVLVKHGISRNCQCVADTKIIAILEYINKYVHT